ncbi:MAG: sensor domain-containing phosphodiesterase [Pseudomonadota bacterium]
MTTPPGAQDRMHTLWRVATDRSLDQHQKIDAMLKAASIALDMDVALVGETDPEYALRYVYDVSSVFQLPWHIALDQTVCHQVMQTQQSLFLDDMGADLAYRQHPLFTQFKFAVYAGAPLWVGDTLYGSLSFLRRKPRQRPYTLDDKTFMELLAAWFGQMLLQIKQQTELRALALTDMLTGLPNRRAAETRLAEEYGRRQRDGTPFAIAICDLDRFKLVNDHYGHEIGDLVLQQAANTLHGHMREGDWLARWGGEEFLIYLHQVDHDQAFSVVDRLRLVYQQHAVNTPHGVLKLTLSAGVSVTQGSTADLTRILAEADSALYEAKNAGRDRIVMHQPAQRNMLWKAGELQSALQTARVMPAYQVMVDLTNGHAVADEALARLVGKDGHILPAADFIEAAEGLHLIHLVDETIARQAMSRCASRLGAGASGTFAHFVNLSPQFLARPELVQQLLNNAQQICGSCSVAQNDIKPLVIEITERQFIGNLDLLVREVQPLLDYGFRLALDDFGSGYSSFLYLAKLPVSFLKIEGWMVANMRHNGKIQDMIQSIVDLCLRQDITTIAENVEDAETAELLLKMGVNWGQGFHFGHPQLDVNSQAIVTL